MDNKSLIVPKKGFFYKIKMFFKNGFNSEKIQEHETYIDYKNDVSQQIKKSSFSDEIKIQKDVEREQLLKMQKDYEDGLIKEEDMTPEQVSKIEKLYIEQISKLREEYTSYKNRTAKLRKKLATNS